jgi:hypothetical protein
VLPTNSSSMSVCLLPLLDWEATQDATHSIKYNVFQYIMYSTL